jgi:hypothetical protein
MEAVALHFFVGVQVAVLSIALYYTNSLARKQHATHALAVFLFAAYAVSLLDATKGHLQYAYSKQSNLAADELKCQDFEYRRNEAKVSLRENRPNSCVEVDHLGNETFVGLMLHSITLKGWPAFLLRYEPTAGVEWLANSHVGYYSAVAWVTGLIVLALVGFIWIRERTRGWLPESPPCSLQPIHRAPWDTSLALPNARSIPSLAELKEKQL